MTAKLVLLTIIIFCLTLCISFILDKTQVSNIKDGVSIFSGIASFITVLIALLLYNKYGLDKTVKNKNLDIVLALLFEIRKIRILVESNSFSCSYGAAIENIEHFESFYSTKLLFPKSYFSDLKPLYEISQDLFLPREIGEKLKIVLPTMQFHVQENTDISDYGKVIINYNQDNNEWKVNRINRDEDVTLFDYLTSWDDLISTVIDWCNRNSNTNLDLNARY